MLLVLRVYGVAQGRLLQLPWHLGPCVGSRSERRQAEQKWLATDVSVAMKYNKKERGGGREREKKREYIIMLMLLSHER